MIYGWHVDSNIARRLELHHGRISDGSFLLDGYHCDHTRQISKMHRSGVRKNNLTEFVNNLTKTNIICGVSDWGLQGDEIEEISLLKRSSSNFCSIITSVLPETQIVPYEVDISLTLLHLLLGQDQLTHGMCFRTSMTSFLISSQIVK